MATGKISKQTVDALQPGSQPDFFWDSTLKGFGVRVTPSGHKSYVFQYRQGGRGAPTRRHTIGAHGSPWTPSTAREEAARLALLVAQGVDPVETRREAERLATDLAFDSYVDLFTKLYLKTHWRDAVRVRRMLDREVVPVLKRKPLPSITRAHLNPIWDNLADRPATARIAFATLRKLFRWAVQRGDLDRSPLEGIVAPRVAPARDRVLNDAELKAFWLATYQLGRPFDAVFRLLALTGQRRQEVAALCWNELDRDEALWTLPASRSKNGKAHLVPLSQASIALLDSVAGGAVWPKKGLRLLNDR